MASSEPAILWDTYQKTRDLTKWYLSKLKEVDVHKQWEVNGVKLNSILWLTTHIAWAENMLILQGTRGPAVELAWLEHYRIGADGSAHEADHTMREALDAVKLVHERAAAHVLSLSEEQLNTENAHGFGFGGDKSYRMLIQHAIRHEGIHAGHLSWLCKINKVDSI